MRVPEWAKGIEARATDLRHRFDPVQEWVLVWIICRVLLSELV
jgi:hypothetical protein